MSKILFVVSSPGTVKSFLLPFINKLSEEHEIHVAANFSDNILFEFKDLIFAMHDIEIVRNPSVFSDFNSLIKLIRIIKKENYDIVHTFTPKAGLLGQLAAFFCMTSKRFHTYTGQVWVTTKGVKRGLLKLFDKTIGTLATFSLVDSPSQRQFLIDNNVIREHKSAVLGNGSISGVNTEKYSFSPEKRIHCRQKLGLNEDSVLLLYAGRLKYDKGIPELVRAFREVCLENTFLAIVGVDEDNLLPLIENEKNIIFCGYSKNIINYYCASDLLCLPSHREGFGNVIIEAASSGLPALASNIYGLSDAVEHGETGLLHKVKDVEDIKSKLIRLISDKEHLKLLGKNAHERAMRDFNEAHVVNELVEFYQK
ncbi:glycosyltransferase family 4 protein [Thalassotalea litorea]|uniref:glycosyltransferase family 4 protein n=1 Tax=Thalassotalea litorea TaxID=2020715 RepID=UPI0037363FFC